MFQLEDGFARPRPDLEVAFNLFWKPNRLIAWAYELVRRLPLSQSPSALKHAEIIERMPPFPELSSRARNCLRVALRDMLDRPVHFLNPQAAIAPVEGYSAPVPPWSFNLQDGGDRIIKVMSQWFDEEKKRLGIKPKTSSKTSKATPGKSRNAHQTHKLGDWFLIETLERKPGECDKERRKLALRHARNYQERVVAGWILAPQTDGLGAHVPPAFFGSEDVNGIVGRVFQATEIISALAQARQESTADSPASSRRSP